MKKLLKFGKKEDGQVIVLFALMLVVLLGFTALAIDTGTVYLTKSKLQNAADAAALAGALDLPNSATAENTAKDYAVLNGADRATTQATTPYEGDSDKIEVICTKNVKYTFARVLGFTDKDVSARAVAVGSKWGGDALPFINLNGYGDAGDVLEAWEMVNPGDKERIHNDDLIIEPNSIKVKYEDGSILFKKGKDLSKIADPLENILQDGKTVYLFAIKNELVGESPYDKLKEGDKIPLEDTVLLQCKVIGDYDVKGNTIITLVLEKVYDYDSVNETFPVENQPSRLVL